MKTAWLALALVASACGSTATVAMGTLQITSPATGTAVTPTGTDHSVPVAFSVTNFTLKAAGTCSGAANCGHVHMVVDGATCNDPTALGPYNNDGFASPIPINLSKCPAVTGAHTVVAELHNDDHSFYKDQTGSHVTSSITITAP